MPPTEEAVALSGSGVPQFIVDAIIGASVATIYHVPEPVMRGLARDLWREVLGKAQIDQLPDGDLLVSLRVSRG